MATNKHKGNLTKGKTLSIVAASLATISIAGVGYASWVVGIQNTEVSQSIGVSVDTSSNQTVILTAELDTDNSIYLGEKGSTTSETENTSETKDTFVKVTGDRPTDLQITFKTLKAEISTEYPVTKYKGIKFEIDTKTETGFTDNKVADGDNHLNIIGDGTDYQGVSNTTKVRPTGSYTYFDIVDTEMLFSEVTPTKANGCYVYDFGAITFNFKWGTFFGNNAPSEYYNALCSSKLDKNYVNAGYINSELTAMHSKYATNNKIKLNISLI